MEYRISRDSKASWFGDVRFGEALRRAGQGEPERAAWRLFAELDEFRGPVDQYDDQTLLMMRVK
jgi:serine phosphatase RsbU (regulator of sigma subunit)